MFLLSTVTIHAAHEKKFTVRPYIVTVTAFRDRKLPTILTVILSYFLPVFPQFRLAMSLKLYIYNSYLYIANYCLHFDKLVHGRMFSITRSEQNCLHSRFGTDNLDIFGNN